MLKIKDILQNKSFKVGKQTSERAELIKFFVENLYNKQGENFTAKRIAIALSHIPTKDLYFMKSVAGDIKSRSGIATMNKWFWWSIKSKN